MVAFVSRVAARRRFPCALLGWAMALYSLPALAGVTPSPRFGNNMVLQRERPVPVWGTARAGEGIQVELGGQVKSTRADGSGNWSVKLDPMPAGGPFRMIIRGGDTLAFENVLVGEVWVCSGQSNMDWAMEMFPNNRDSAKNAYIPKLRLMDMRGDGKWRQCNPASAAAFSATGFFFGKELHRALDVPVGLIEASVGGTKLEPWMDPESIAADPELSASADPEHGSLYRNWVEPILPYAIRGVIWYQGEGNANNGTSSTYHSRFSGLIRGWRKAWGQGQFPFNFVQLANFREKQTLPVEETQWVLIREAQRMTLDLPNTAMVVAVDIGEAGNVHPRNKRDVGYRLTLPARALLHGQDRLVHSGPLYESMTVDGGRIHLRFRHAGGGLKAGGGEALAGFAIAGEDNQWEWAYGEIRGRTVVVSSARVPAPTQVRYAWADNPVGNLFNAEGLPASPFRTDGPRLPVGLEPSPAASSRISPAVGDAPAYDLQGRFRQPGRVQGPLFIPGVPAGSSRAGFN